MNQPHEGRMNPFFEELRRAREAKKISLEHISDVTLINRRFLEAIEEGNTAILPQAYVRAFLREYAAVIGLDAEETLKRYDAARSGEPAEEEAPQPEDAREKKPEAKPARRLLSRPTVTKLVTGLVVVGTIVTLVIVTRRPGGETPVSEIPFQNAVKENETRIAASLAEKEVSKATPSATPSDSLTLSATVTDSVWMQISIDDQPPLEYLFSHPHKISWKAQNRFLVTLGNAGSVQFTLMDKPLGTLGKRGTVIRNVEISRKNLSPK